MSIVPGRGLPRPPAASCRRESGGKPPHSRSLPPLVDQTRHERGPSRLMRCAESLTCVSVEEFVEEDEVPPVRVVRDEFRLTRAARTVDRTVSILVRKKQSDQAIRETRGDSAEREHLHLAITTRGRGRHLQTAAERFLQLAQCFDDQKAGGEPHRSAPVAVSAFQSFDRFGRLISHRSIAEGERILLMRLAEAAQSIWRQELLRIDDTRQERLQ